MSVIAPGTCRHCACTEACACRLQTGDTCCWVDCTRLVCSNPSCVLAEAKRTAAAKRAAKEAQPKSLFAQVAAEHPKWERGAILAEVRRLERRRGKGCAA